MTDTAPDTSPDLAAESSPDRPETTTADNPETPKDITDSTADTAGESAAQDAPAEEAPSEQDPAQETPADAPPERTFADFGVLPAVAAALERAGIVHPFPIQAMTLPVALAGHDIIGQAKTGTGKTLGFGVPLLSRVAGPADAAFAALSIPGAPQALVVVPTRELASQVARDVEQAATDLSARVLVVYGGRAYEPQVEALTRGVEVVVGTPGRLIDLAQQGHLRLGEVRTVVLDEADEMLDLGFLPDVEKLLAMTPAGRQTMLFSATMPGPVVALARRYMTQPTHIRAADPDDGGAWVKAIRQVVYRAHAMDKVEVLGRILQARDRGLTIVFARTKRTAAKVADDLATRGFAAAPLHGDLGQGAREQALRAFRAGKVDVLVATDVAARGIDVTNVTHVINYQCPEDENTYLHRTGRTGRAGATGTAVTFVDWDDLHRWSMIDRTLGLGIPEPEETYSTSPHLYEELDIPAGTTGSLPRSARTRAGLGAEEVEDLGETGRGPRARSGGAGAGRRDGSARDGSARDGSARDGSARQGGPRGGGGRARGNDSTREGVRPPAAPAAPPQSRSLKSGALASGSLDLSALETVAPAESDLASAPGRRRRRGAGQGAAGERDTARPAPAEGGTDAQGPSSVDESAGGPARAGSDAPRRRRRRGGRGRSGGSASTAPAADGAVAPAPEVTAD